MDLVSSLVVCVGSPYSEVGRRGLLVIEYFPVQGNMKISKNVLPTLFLVVAILVQIMLVLLEDLLIESLLMITIDNFQLDFGLTTQ
jgi:hypothetical protein